MPWEGDRRRYTRAISIAILSRHRASQQQAATYLQAMEVGSTFHFYHADLSPTNVIVSTEGSVTAILDWESAAFCPRM